MKFLKVITKLLVIIGALNWGLVGFFQFDLVSAIFGGEASTGARVVFAIVGLAGVCALISLCSCCWGSNCSSCGCSSGSCGCCKKKNRED